MRKVWVTIFSFLAVGGLVWFLSEVFSGRLLLSADYYFGFLKIHMYSWLLFAATFTGLLWVIRKAQVAGLSQVEAENLVLLVVVFGLIGARLHHVLTAFEYYKVHLWDIFFIWRGGLGIFGGILGGLVATYAFSKAKKKKFTLLLDLLAPAAILGQSIGRWGNLFNYELYGRPTEIFVKMFVPEYARISGYRNFEFFHPTFLYESAWNFFVFLILWKLFKKQMRPGTVFAWYLVLYAIGRYYIETLKLQPTMAGSYLLNQILSLALMGIGAMILIGLNKVSGFPPAFR